MLAAMLLVYGACCFGSMKRVAVLYFALAFINAAIYPIFLTLDNSESSKWYPLIYGYGVTESYLKLLYLVGFWNFNIVLRENVYRWLMFISLLHIVNDAFNNFHYGVFNDALIMCEMACFLMGAKNVIPEISGLFGRISSSDIWVNGSNRGSR